MWRNFFNTKFIGSGVFATGTIGAAYHFSGRSPVPCDSRAMLKSAVCNEPHADKRYKGGEDGWAIGADGTMIMVADGVGGWANKGVDPGIFTKNMCKRAAQMYAESFAGRDLKSILVEAVKQTPEKGSCTVVMASLEDDTLKTINLGDSGYIIYTDKKKVYRTTEQQHYFNCPY